MEFKQRIQQRMIEFVRRQIRRCLLDGTNLAARPTGYYSVTLGGLCLTQILFWDSPEAQEKNGSSGRTRIPVKTLPRAARGSIIMLECGALSSRSFNLLYFFRLESCGKDPSELARPRLSPSLVVERGEF